MIDPERPTEGLELPAAPAPAKPHGRLTLKGLWASLRLHILHPELTPRQLAWSFALGFSIAWNPLMGLHLTMVVVLCFFVKGLHRPLMFLAVFINNPWTMVPMATFSTVAGNVLLGRGLHIDLSRIDWQGISLASFTSKAGLQALLAMFQPILAPYLLGASLISLLAIPAGYYIMLAMTKRLRRLHFHSHP